MVLKEKHHILRSITKHQILQVDDLEVFLERAGNGNPLQYSCLENSMDRGAWRASVYGVTKSHTLLSNHHSLTHSPERVVSVMHWGEKPKGSELRSRWVLMGKNCSSEA